MRKIGRLLLCRTTLDASASTAAHEGFVREPGACRAARRSSMVAGMARPRGSTLAALGASAALVAHAAPALTNVDIVRRRLFPGLSGTGTPGHVALTFDDGPQPGS